MWFSEPLLSLRNTFLKHITVGNRMGMLMPGSLPLAKLSKQDWLCGHEGETLYALCVAQHMQDE